jgi:hypothetical protein
MHIEVLVEDASGKSLLSFVLPLMLGEYGAPHTWRIHAYRGIGRIPKNMRGKTDASKRILLDRLPKILAGYGLSQRGRDEAVLVVVDLDDRDCVAFKLELNQILNGCNPRPRAMFRIAIEEMEAWLLGDRKALIREFPRAKTAVLNSYEQDSICGTWERLADAVYPGGVVALRGEGWAKIGAQKGSWASQIGRHMSLRENLSPSFHALRLGLAKLCGEGQ